MKEITTIILVLFVAILCTFSTLQAQVIDESYCPMYNIEEPAQTSAKLMSSCNSSTDICTGKYKPGKGTLKMLMVYMRFADDNTSMSYWNSTPNPNDIYDVETWMANSIDETTTENSDNYFNISNYFSEMSRDSFNIIGKAVYIELPSKSTFKDQNNNELKGLALMEATNKYALEYLDNSTQIDLSDYDNFDYVSEYHHDQTSDNILDMVYMVYRTPGLQHFARKDTPGFEYDNFGGIARLGKTSAQVALPSGLEVNYGLYGDGSGLTMHLGNDRKVRFDDSYIHELAHYLMGYSHPYTDGSYYVNTVGRTGYWGIFGGSQATNSVNAYEQELLGWITPTQLTSSTADSLEDFLTTGEALKYIISSDEYYYFENRQKIQTTTGIDDTYDQPNWNNDDKGLFVLHVKENSGGYYLYSSGNSLESVVSDGNWDWNLDGFASTCNSSGEPAFEKDVPNRFGESFKDPIMEVDNPNDSKGTYKQALFVKASKPTQCKKYFLGYDSEDKSGFTEIERSLITPYTNPTFLTRSKSQEGIGLKITGKNGNTLSLKFYDDTFDPYTITENTTWDGQIFLDDNVTVQSGNTLTIKPNTTVYLADGKSVTVYGTLTADNVTFTAMNNNWTGITFQSGSDGYIRNSLIEKVHSYGGSAIRINSTSNSIGIHDNVLRDMTGAIKGIYLSNNTGTLYIYRNDIQNLSGNAIEVYNSTARIFKNFIKNYSGSGVYASSYSDVLFSGVSYPNYKGKNTIVGGKYGIRSGYQATLNAGNTSTFANENRIANQTGSGWAHIYRSGSGSTTYGQYNYYKPYNGSGGVAPTIAGSGGTISYTPWLTNDPDPGTGFKSTSANRNENQQISKAMQLRHEGKYVEAEAILTELILNADDEDLLQQSLIQYGWLARMSGEDTYTVFLESKKEAFGWGELEATVISMLASIHYSKSNYIKALEKLDELYKKYPESEHAFQASVLAGYVAEDAGKRKLAQQYLQQASILNPPSLQTTNKENLLSGLQLYLDSRSSEVNPAPYNKQNKSVVNTSATSLSNYPNPFNPTTNITFSLPQQSQVTLVVYYMLGRKVATLVNDVVPAGQQTVLFDASNLANGMYLYKLRAGEQEMVKKMTLIK